MSIVLKPFPVWTNPDGDSPWDAISFEPFPDWTNPDGDLPWDVIPEPEPPPPVTPPRATVAKVYQPIEYKLNNAAAKDAYVPIIYGRDKAGAKVFAATLTGNTVLSTEIVIGAGWCLGEVEEIEKVYVDGVSTNDDKIKNYVSITNYLGTSTQTANARLAASISGYSDDCIFTMPNGEKVGVCYTVAKLGRNAADGFPELTARIKGFKVYDPRDGGQDIEDRSTWEWSDNPALHISDFARSAHYGANLSVDQSSVSVLADRNDKIIDVASSTPLRTLNLTMDRSSKTETWMEVLRGYAACFIVHTDDGLAFPPDAPTAVTASITASHIIAGSFQPVVRGLLNNPTVVEVTYTEENASTEWMDETVEVVAPGVSTGVLPRIVSKVKMQGIHSHHQAMREALIRFNHFYLEDLEVTFDTFDEGLKRLEGDVIHADHPIGISQNLRVTKVTQQKPGRWRLGCREYQAVTYSSSFEAGDLTSDTSFPDPADVPAITGLAAVEEVFQLHSGLFSSRLRVTWSDPAVTYPYALLYTVSLVETDTGEVVWQNTGTEREVATSAVKEAQQYYVRCHAHTSSGHAGAVAEINITPAGKYLIPTDIADLDGYEVGGEVRLFWTASIDIDIYRYEVRYGVTQDWDSMTVIDQIDSLRLMTADVPVGDWWFGVKALDSVRQYSTNAAFVQITVTLDSSAYLVDTHDFSAVSATVSNVHEFQNDRVDNIHHFITIDGSSMASAFPNALNTYSAPIAALHGIINGSWESDVWDIGTLVTGNFRATYATGFSLTSALGTDVSATMMLAQTNSAGTVWDEYPALTKKTAARFAKFRVESVASATMHFTIPRIRMRVDVVPRAENGELATFAKRPVIELNGVSGWAGPPVESSAICNNTVGWNAKTHEAIFIPASTTARQTVYMQGTASAGIHMYVDNGQFYAGAWESKTLASSLWTNTSVFAGSQYHAIFRYSEASARLAINGVSVSHASGSMASIPGTPTGNIAIGGMWGSVHNHDGSITSGWAYKFKGTIFRVTQYNRRITDAEVSSHSEYIYPSSTSLVMDYNFNVATTLCSDGSPSNNDCSVEDCTYGPAPMGRVDKTAHQYYRAQSITITPIGAASRTATIDNIIHGDRSSWLTYIHDADGSAVVASALWEFKGV